MKRVLITSLALFSLALSAQAQSVDLLWQGEAFTPPFYEGRTLWSSQSRVTFVAIPQGLGNANFLNYKWTKNGTVLGNISGVGKNTLSFEDSVISRPQTIKVDVIGSDGAVLASNTVSINAQSPSLLVYENSPLYGAMFHREVGQIFPMRESEVTFTAIPFLFSGSANYSWRTNSGEVSNTNSVTFRIPEETSGSSQVSIDADSVNKILQSASRNFLIRFSQ